MPTLTRLSYLINKGHRPGDTNIHAAVITQKEFEAGKKEIDLLLPAKQEKHGLSALGTGISSQAPKDHVAITVPTTTVMNILQEQRLEDISYINIDVEGYDEAVLQDIDLNRYRPMVISVEQFAEDVIDVVNGEAARYMREHNYHFHSRASFTSIFVKANGT